MMTVYLNLHLLTALEPKNCVLWTKDGQHHRPDDKGLRAFYPGNENVGGCALSKTP